MEKFFSIIVGNDSKVAIIEFLNRRYNNIEFILHMPVDEFADFLQIAREKEEDERLHIQWVAMLPDMSKGYLKYVPFDRYKEQCTGASIDYRSTDDIVKELEELHGTKLL